MIFLLNLTTGKMVRDDSGEILKCTTCKEAQEMLDRVNDIKTLNPKHANDLIVMAWDCCP